MSRRGFTLVELMISLTIIALLAAIAVPNLLRAKYNANQTVAKAACRSIITDVLSAQTSIGHMPSYAELREYVEEPLFLSLKDQNDVTTSHDVATPFKAYVFCYFHTIAGKSVAASGIRGVQALPITYNPSNAFAFYKTNESGQVFGTDANNLVPGDLQLGDPIDFFTGLRFESDLGETWTSQ